MAFALPQKRKGDIMIQKPRLQFTEKKRADPFLNKVIQKSEKKSDKLDKAKAKIPKNK